MKVKDLIKVLENHDPEASVIIARDVEFHGFGYVDTIEPGIFRLNEEANDFLEYETMCIGLSEERAVCLYPESGKLHVPKKIEQPQ